MPKFTWSKWRVLVPALVAGFLALMCAGPGTLIVPSAARLAEPLVCRQGAEIEYRRVRYGYHRPGESTVEVRCLDRAAQSAEDVFGRTVLALFGLYFLALFVPLLLLAVASGRGATPPGQLPRPEPEAEREVRALLAGGREVEAIRRVREATGAGLGQAKAYVDSLSEQAQAEGARGPGPQDPVARLRRLKEMADSGLITEQEYEVKKGEILSGM